MKKILLTLSTIALVIFGAYSQTDKATDVDQPRLKFKSTEIDYGSITLNSDGVTFFEFTNTGKAPLLITNVSPSCGCTVVEWPKEPINPGDKGSITVKYNTAIYGSFNKSIRVFSNVADKPVILMIKGEVKSVPECKEQDLSTSISR